MSAKAKATEPLRYDAPCAACHGPHPIDACDTEAAVKLLEADGKVMTSVKVRDRARAKAGAS